MGLGGGSGTSTADSTTEGFQWSILILVAASEEEKKNETKIPAKVEK